MLLAPGWQVRGKRGLVGEHEWDLQLPNVWTAFNCSPKDALAHAEEVSVLVMRTRGCWGKEEPAVYMELGSLAIQRELALRIPEPMQDKGPRTLGNEAKAWHWLRA